MPWTTGSYAESDNPATLRSRLYWLRSHIVGYWLARRRHPEDTGAGTEMRREWGAWVIRPSSGLRSHRFTPALQRNRSIPARDRDAALDWWQATASI